MANQKITELTALGAGGVAAGDLVPVADVSATATKSVRADLLLAELIALATSASPVYVSGTALIVAPGAGGVYLQASNNAGTQYRLRVYHDAGNGSYVDSMNGNLLLRAAAASKCRLWNTNGYLALEVLCPDGHDGGPVISAPLTPAQITADQNDYNPGQAWTYRLSSDASRTLTGISVAQLPGQRIHLVNVGAQNVVLAHQSVSSTAANRLICTGGADVTLAADEEVVGWYDATASRWRMRKV